MSTSDPLDARVLQHKTLLLLVIAVSAAFAWILWPFYGAILWAAILAIIAADCAIHCVTSACRLH